MVDDDKGWYFYRGNIPCVKEDGLWEVVQRGDQTLVGRRMDIVLCRETEGEIVAKAVSSKGEKEWALCSGMMTAGVTGEGAYEGISHERAVLIMFECDRRRKPELFK